MPKPVAPPAPVASQAAVQAPAALESGTILAVRPIVAMAGATAPLLRAGLGANPGDSTVTPRTPTSEFIVRLADGSLLSVVQPSSTALHPGEAVSVRRDAPPRIAALQSGHIN